MIIAVDFDGTMVRHAFPKIGEPVPHAIEVVKKLISYDVKIILYTMRGSLQEDNYLDQAVKYMEGEGIKLYGVNENPDQHWTNSPKVHADYVVDDRAIGCPLHYEYEGKIIVDYYVDWIRVFDLIKFRVERFEGRSITNVND